MERGKRARTNNDTEVRGHPCVVAVAYGDGCTYVRVDQARYGSLGEGKMTMRREEGVPGDVADHPVQLRTMMTADTMVMKSISAMAMEMVKRTKMVSMGTCKCDAMSDDGLIDRQML